MRTLILIIITCIVASAWGGQQPTIHLRERSTVNGARFTLGDIGTFSGLDTATEARLKTVVLGSSPLPGLERAITREQVLTRLRQHGFQPEAFDIVAPSRVVVRREAHLVPAQRIVDTAVQKLRQAANLPEEAQIECDVPPRDISLPDGNPKVTASEPRALGGGLYLVPLQVSSEGSPTISLNVRLRVKRWCTAVVASQAIRTGEAISADAVVVQPVAITTGDADMVVEPEEVIGKVARRPIPAGQPIRRSSLDEPAVIRHGQNVKLVVHLDGAVIETAAVALQDGKVGARIRVQVIDTRKTLLATVADGETVAVELR